MRIRGLAGKSLMAAKTTPHMYIIDSHRNIGLSGGIATANGQSGRYQKLRAITCLRPLSEIKSGDKVSVAQAAPLWLARQIMPFP